MEGIFCPAPPARRLNSEDYVVVDSRHVRDELEMRGWRHLSTQFSKRNPAGKHLLRFEHPKLEGTEGIPQILVWNSYDGSYSLRLQTGFFRFVCMNGLVIGTTVDRARIIHRGEPAKAWTPQLWETLGQMERVPGRIQEMKNREMSDVEILDFGTRALAIRFGLDYTARLELPLFDLATKAVEFHRPEDEDNTLWNVMNRTQENLLHGGFRSPRSNRRTIALNPRAQAVFNSRLWDEVVSTYLS